MIKLTQTQPKTSATPPKTEDPTSSTPLPPPSRGIDLSDALAILAARIGKPHAELLSYAAEDKIGGYNAESDKAAYPAGSTWAVDGTFLYVLVRALRPDHVVEIGTYRGCGATHILTAMERNEVGMMTSVDIAECGDLIPENLRHRMIKIRGRASEVAGQLEPAQIVFEDAAHTTDDVRDNLKVARALDPQVLISHDAEHYIVGNAVRKAWEEAFGNEFQSILIRPSDCGFAIKIAQTSTSPK